MIEFLKKHEKIVLNIIYIIVPFFIWYGVVLLLISLFELTITKKWILIASGVLTIFYHPLSVEFRKNLFTKQDKQNNK